MNYLKDKFHCSYKFSIFQAENCEYFVCYLLFSIFRSFTTRAVFTLPIFARMSMARFHFKFTWLKAAYGFAEGTPVILSFQRLPAVLSCQLMLCKYKSLLLSWTEGCVYTTCESWDLRRQEIMFSCDSSNFQRHTK